MRGTFDGESGSSQTGTTSGGMKYMFPPIGAAVSKMRSSQGSLLVCSVDEALRVACVGFRSQRRRAGGRRHHFALIRTARTILQVGTRQPNAPRKRLP